jgi:cytochrome bd-type quinol oxidase subunit 1
MEITHLLFVQWQLGLALAIFQGLMVLGFGLAWVMAIWQWLIGTNPQARSARAYRSWLGIFSIVFRLVFGFGLVVLTLVAINWPALFERTGNVLGPILLGLVVVAFVLKTTLFRVMLHEQGRVSDSAYTFSVLGVALFYTAMVIGWVVMDVWLRAPVGASLIDGRFQVLDERAILLNNQVGWQLVMTVLGAVLATVGWLVGRPSSQRHSDNAHHSPDAAVAPAVLPSRLFGWLCLVGFVAGMSLLPMAGFAITQWLPDGVSMLDLLMARDLPLSTTLASSTALVLVTRLIAVMVLLYLVLIVCAYITARNGKTEQPYLRRLPVGLLFLGPMLWASLWLLSYLGKGGDVVVGHLSFTDLVNPHATILLWFSAAFLLLATATTFVGLWQGFFMQPEEAEPAAEQDPKQQLKQHNRPQDNPQDNPSGATEVAA